MLLSCSREEIEKTDLHYEYVIVQCMYIVCTLYNVHTTYYIAHIVQAMY